MADENPEGASQATFAKEVLKTLEAVAFKKGELKPLFEEVEQNPDNYSTSQQLGNALRPYMKEFEKNKYNEAAATLAKRYDKEVAKLFPDVSFDKDAKLEENLQAIKSYIDSKKPEKKQESNDQITDRQLANHPSFQAMKAKVEALESTNAQLASDKEFANNRNDIIASTYAAIYGLEKPLDFSDDPYKRNRQINALINDLVQEVRYQKDENGKLVKGNDGYPIPVDSNGDPLFDKDNNKDIGFSALIPKYSLVGFRTVEPQEPESKNGMRDFRDPNNKPNIPAYPGKDKDVEYLASIQKALGDGNFQLARDMQQARADVQQSTQ
ncbi:hypothetical protein [Gilvibacter sp.]|uniref:hypothetical protein n=1 Tax=Gilvibacter sp. TaxID=2729997 RepID=UPI0025C0B3A2|nr:hypothetical protein [Gilvibacter sp.]NQX77519.1 hypothetical protein [Gilvibacter sp.]